MAISKTNRFLYDPRTGGLAIRSERLRLANGPHEPAHTNYFSIYRVQSGSGTAWADATEFAFAPDTLLFFVPYKHVRFAPKQSVRADLIQFHANFLCVETFHAEVGCSGILFNDPYGLPVVALDESAKAEVDYLIERIGKEQSGHQLAFPEVMLAHRKVLLVLATRLKTSPATACGPTVSDPWHPLLMDCAT